MTDCRSRRGVLAPLLKASAEGNKGNQAVTEFSNARLSWLGRECWLAKTFGRPSFILLGMSLYQPKRSVLSSFCFWRSVSACHIAFVEAKARASQGRMSRNAITMVAAS
jgi:hypothetical protein